MADTSNTKTPNVFGFGPGNKYERVLSLLLSKIQNRPIIWLSNTETLKFKSAVFQKKSYKVALTMFHFLIRNMTHFCTVKIKVTNNNRTTVLGLTFYELLYIYTLISIPRNQHNCHMQQIINLILL